jgi:queuine tRNA-ribosyltransferase
MFKLIKKDKTTKARLGILTTSHGQVESPFFMPVGTNGTVKSVSADHLLEFDTQIMLSNTYHLYLRPGMDVMEHAGGLHKFMSWDRPILTDSGGYQVFSLSKLRKITDEGVKFQSHLDGSSHFLTPESIVDIERILGSDIMMPLDECAPYPCERAEAERSVKRTTQWAKRSRQHFLEKERKWHEQFLFGIIQGATFDDLRRQSAEEIMNIGFDGYAIGGVSVGEPVEMMFKTLDWVMPLLPEDKPRYFMGIGLPDQMVKAVGEGIDMFDTCIPTRYGRHASAFTSRGKIIIRNAEFAKDLGPIDDSCGCHVCKKYSRSYLRHLMSSHETLGLTLVSYHNVYFYVNLMRRIREAIKEERYEEFQNDFLRTYNSELLIEK